MAKVSPTILGSNLLRIEEEINKIKDADFLHYDVMDGHFVPNITYGVRLYDQIKEKFPSLKIEVHLMVREVEKFIEYFSKPYCYIFHPSSTVDIPSTIKLIRSKRSKVGIALNPDESFDKVGKYKSSVDLVLVAGSYVGFGGQKLFADTFDRVKYVRKRFKGLIEVDCGVNGENAKKLVEAGTDILVSGAYIFERDTEKRLNYLKSL